MSDHLRNTKTQLLSGSLTTLVQLLEERDRLREESGEARALLLECLEVLMNLVYYSDDDRDPDALRGRVVAFLAKER